MLSDAHQKHIADLVHMPHIARACEIRKSTRERQKKMALKAASERRSTGVGLFRRAAAEVAQRQRHSEGNVLGSGRENMRESSSQRMLSVVPPPPPPPPPPQASAQLSTGSVSAGAMQTRVQV